MKNVSGSFQYFSNMVLILLPLFAEPTMRGTSFRSSRLLVSYLAHSTVQTADPLKIWRMYGRCISSECSSSSTPGRI